ncbi:MAG: HAD family hydrolase [Planctomycetota bacterium]|jgi:putative hydrolase of the HAD superfamily
MIKAIIFDFGNVICHFDNNIFLEKISSFTDKTASELNDLIYNSTDFPRQYETGLISSDKFFNEIKRRCDLSMSKIEFIKSYTDIFTPIRTTINLIRRLKSIYKIALLSNTNKWDFEHIIKTCEVYNLFDAVSLSFRVRAMKPDNKIFLDSISKLRLKPEECVYIDDIEGYVEAAKQIGINGIHYVSFEKLISSLKGLSIQL